MSDLGPGDGRLYIGLRLANWPFKLLAYSGACLLAVLTAMIDGGEDPFLQAIHLEQGDFAWLVHVTWACWPVVAKLDRLGRNVAFLSALLRYGVEFVACDNPAANKLTLHILAAVAEAEAEATSARTKAALAAYKARGGKLGASLSVSEPDTRGAPQGHSGVGSSTKG